MQIMFKVFLPTELSQIGLSSLWAFAMTWLLGIVNTEQAFLCWFIHRVVRIRTVRRAIRNMCEEFLAAQAVPNGKLVFFPSHEQLNDAVSHWRMTGLLERKEFNGLDTWLL